MKGHPRGGTLGKKNLKAASNRKNQVRDLESMNNLLDAIANGEPIPSQRPKLTWNQHELKCDFCKMLIAAPREARRAICEACRQANLASRMAALDLRRKMVDPFAPADLPSGVK